MIQARELVEAHVYESEEAAIEDALRRLLRSKPDVRIRLAIHRYQTGRVSLAKAAEIAGVCWAEMCEVLREEGIPLRLGPESIDEAQQELQTLTDYLEAGA